MDGMADRIRKRRLALNMSQLELAYAVETSPNQISRYERGETTPNIDMLRKLARTLKCSSDWLLGLVEGAEARFCAEDSVAQRLVDAWTAGALEDVIEIVVGEMRRRKR